MKKTLLTMAMMLCLIFAKAQSEVEPNNTILQIDSNTFTAPVTISANIVNSPDIDFFKIILPYCGSWKINIINPTHASCVINMNTYNSQNTGTGHVIATGFNFNNLPDPLIIVGGGTLFIGIDQASGADLGAYLLEVVPDTTNDIYECNNYFSEASVIPINTVITNKIFGYMPTSPATGDPDIFKVVVPRDGVLNIHAFNIGGGAPTTDQDIIFTVYQPDSTMQIGDTGNATCNQTSIEGCYLVRQGDVYIKVQDSNGSLNCQSGYDLSSTPFNIEFSFDTTDVCELNNTFAAACTTDVNSTQQIKLWGFNSTLSTIRSEDMDVYVLDAPRDGVVNITASNIGAGGTTIQDVVIEVYQPDTVDATLIGSAGAGNCNEQTITGSFLVRQGIFYVRILDSNGSLNCQGGYDLSNTPFTLTFDFDTSDVCEGNNNFLDACLVIPNISMQTKLWGVNNTYYPTKIEDRDYYKLQIPQCSELIVEATNIGGGGSTNQDIVITLYMSDTTTTIGSIGDSYCDRTTVGDTFAVQPGLIYVKVQDSDGSLNCQGGYDMSNTPFTLSFTLLNCVGVEEMNPNTNFSVYPNPAVDELKISILENHLRSKIRIMNLLGSVIHEIDPGNTTEISVDLKDYAKGIYLIELSNSSGIAIKKFIKE